MVRRVVINTRKAGIDVIGDVSWGTHICQFYQTKEDLTDIFVPYFKAGLENNEFCVWITSEPLVVQEARAALNEAIDNLDDYFRKGQIEILDFSEYYTRAGIFDVDEVLRCWLEKGNLAIDKGFDGLRAAGNASWLEHEDWRSLIGYESIMNGVMRRRRVITICAYSLDRYGATELVDVVSSHQNVLIRRSGKWELIQNNGHKPISFLTKNGMTYAEIGRRLGLSRERVRQIMTGQRVHKKGPARNTSDGLLTSSQAARLLNIHVNTLRRWSNEGTLRTYRVGNRRDRRFKRRDLEQFLRQAASTASIAT